MNDTPLGRFFGVVRRPQTWLTLVFHVFAFPLGLFYFIFLVVGLSVGLGLVIIWVGIPILLVVAGAWWLFGEFERLQARALLGAQVPDAPRSWETVEGIWGKVKAHFGNGATWKDLAYLLAKLAFGVVSFTLVVTLAALVGWLFALPFATFWHVAVINYGDGQTWTPPLWLAVLGVPAGVLMFFASLHITNAWGWVCARWAEVMLRAGVATPPVPVPSPAPLVSTSPQPPLPPAPPAPPQYAVPPAPPAPPQGGHAQYPPPQYAPPQYAPPQAPPQGAQAQYPPPQYAPPQYAAPQAPPQDAAPTAAAPASQAPAPAPAAQPLADPAATAATAQSAGQRAAELPAPPATPAAPPAPAPPAPPASDDENA
jgi:hypothetical protein